MKMDAGVTEILNAIIKAKISLVLLREDGRDLMESEYVASVPAVYVAGSHVDLPPDIELLVSRSSSDIVSVGPTSLLTSHVIAYISWLRNVLVSGCRCARRSKEAND